MDLEGLFQLALLPMVTIIFTFLVVDLFDSAGTIVGLAHQGKLLDENYQMEGLGHPLVADPSATLKMDLEGLFQLALLPMVTIIFTFLVVDLFDSAGTIVGLAHQGKLLDENYQMEGLGRPLVADSVGTVAGAALGTSTVTTYIESASGIEAGGKSGLTAVVIGILFLAALFIAPLAQSIPSYATAAAILFVAAVMARALGETNWDDATDYVPAIVMALAMPLTFSITAGIGIGFFCYIAIKLLTFRFRDLNIAVLVVGAIFALYFAPTLMKLLLSQ